MQISCAVVRLLQCFIFATVFHTVICGPIITEVIPWFGGAEGGTDLEILGTNFAPDGIFSNRAVYIGAEVCTIINYFSSNDRIVCKTPKCVTTDCLSDQQWQGYEDSTLNVYVSDVTGIKGDQAEYRYHGGYTPDVAKMFHYTWANTISSVTGKMVTDLVTDITIKIGGNRMDLGDDGELNDETINMWNRYQQIRYLTPGDVVAGFYNLTLDVQTDLSRGYRGSGVARMFPVQKPFYYNYDVSYVYNFASTLSGVVHSMAVLPTITGVSPSVGSVAGGTILTIYGHGFSMEPEDMIVYVSGRPCDVVDIVYTRDVMTCITREAESRETLANMLLTRTDESIQFKDENVVLESTRAEGSAGWWMKMWPYSVYTSNTNAFAEYPAESVAFDGGFRHGLRDGFYYSYGWDWYKSFPYMYEQRYVADFSTLLRAPISGIYYFQGLVDDTMHMFGRGVNDTDEVLLFSTSYRSSLKYYSNSQLPDISEGVNLTRGELYHLRARVVNTGGPDWFEVGMRIIPNMDGSYVEEEDCPSCTAPELPSLPSDWPETLLHHHTLKEVQSIDLDIYRQYEMHTYTITGVTAGYFQFVVFSEPTNPLYLDSTGDYIAEQLRYASLRVSSSFREAEYYTVTTSLDGTTLQLNITFIRDDPAPVTPLFILLGTLEGPFPDFEPFPTIIQYHSPLPGGTFDLDLIINDRSHHVDVPYGISSNNLIRTLEALNPDITVEVLRQGSLYTGYSWTVTFLSPRGDIPQMMVNASTIQNVPATGTVSTLEDGDERILFFDVIPTWMTEVPLEWATDGATTSNVEVYVSTGRGNTMKAVCDSSDSTNNLLLDRVKGREEACEYNYAVNATAITTNFTLEEVDAVTTKIIITGSRYLNLGDPAHPPDLTVTVAGQFCNVTSLSNSLIECLVDSVPWGEHAPQVYLDGFGYALLATNATLRFKQTIYSISPDRGSFAGGQIVTIAGRGFRMDANVTFGDLSEDAAACEVISISSVEIVCRTPAALDILEGRRLLETEEAGSTPTVEPTTEPTISPTIFPNSNLPTTEKPTTSRPTTEEPTIFPSTILPSTLRPTTSRPTTEEPSPFPSTVSPSTTFPSTLNPTTSRPTTEEPTPSPSTSSPTTLSPSTSYPTTNQPTSEKPTHFPTTSQPSTSSPTTERPTLEPTAVPTIPFPTHLPTAEPSATPTTAAPTYIPTNEPTAIPTTSTPSFEPTTSPPTAVPTFSPTSLDSYTIFVDGQSRTGSDIRVVYSYLEELTPKVSMISPGVVSSAITTNLTVFGELLNSPDISVTVEGQVCDYVKVIDDSEVMCLLKRNMDFGAARAVDVKVHVPGLGYGGNASSLNILPTILRGFELSELSPVAGSLVGGNILTISGFGFSSVALEKHSIILQIVGITPLTTYDELLGFLGFELFTTREDYEEFECIPTSSSFYELVCEIPSHHGVLFSNYTYDVSVTLNSVVAVCTSSNDCQYTQEIESTPIVNATVDVLDVTVDGEYTIKVYGSLLDYGYASVWMNELVCTVSDVTSFSMIITTPPMTAGLWDVVVNVAGLGHAWSTAQLLVDANIREVEFASSYGSLAGGTDVIIRGAGFSPVCRDNHVTFQVDQDGAVVELSAQDFLSCTATTIILQTSSLLPFVDVDVHRFIDRDDLKFPLLLIQTQLDNAPSSEANISWAINNAAFEYTIGGTPLAIMNDTAGFAGTPVLINAYSSAQDMNDTTSVTIGGKECQELKVIDSSVDVPGLYTYVRQCNAPELPAKSGSYPVLINIPPLGYAVNNASYNVLLPKYTSELRFDSVADGSVPSSFLGGKVMTVPGRGLSNDTSVSVCDKECTPISFGYNNIECILPNRTTIRAVDDLVAGGFNVDMIETITGTYIGSRSYSLDNVHDGDYETYFKHYDLSCFVGVQLPTGYRARPYRLRYYPRLRYSGYIGDFAFEGSKDGGSTYVTIAEGSGAHEGWNFVNAQNMTNEWFNVFRYRALDTTSYSQCYLAEMDVLGMVAAEDEECSITVTQPLVEASGIVGTVLYKSTESFTPSIHSISPDNGTALGGTHVRIVGSYLSPYNSTEPVSVEFSGVTCEVITAGDTYIDCITGRRRPENVETSSIRVHVPGRGLALVGDDVEYLFIDRWSALTSWRDQEPPIDGDVVWIPDGQVILLDGSTPRLVFLLVEGALYGDRTQDISIDARYIFVLGGYFEIGTEEEPFERSAVITMRGDRYKTIEMPIFGAKVVAVADRGAPVLEFESGAHTSGRDNGQLEIHGQKRLRTWTKINETAIAGQRWLITSERVDFRNGEEVVITNTGLGPSGGIEIMTVSSTSMDGHNVSFTSPLILTHESKVVLIEGRHIDMRLEIGLLSRNVKIQGDEYKSDGQLFGVHTVAAGSGIFRIENTEITRCGQAFVFGRYCTHTHKAGNMEGSYVKANSIHHSYQRAVTTHDSHNWEVRDNVAYDVMGHAYFVEDGTELYNYITGNLGIAIKPSSALLKSDKAPAIFWTATPTNFWRDNVAVHSAARGFWFELPGSIDNGAFCPARQEVGEYVNMTYHSNSGIGLRIYPNWTPRKNCNGEPDPQYLYDQVSWGNGGNGIFARRQGAVHHFGSTLAGNRGDDVFMKKLQEVEYNGIPFLHNILFVGRVEEDFDEASYVGKSAIFGPQDEYFYARNCTFVNYGSGPGAITGCAGCLSGPDMKQGGFTSRYEGLKWVNTMKRLIWSTTQKEILWDLDGTLGGVADSMITKSYKSIRWPDVCTVLEYDQFDESVRCGGNGSTARIRRMQLDDVDPRQLDFTDVIIRSSAGENEHFFLPLDSYGWVFPVVTGDNRTYTFEWRDAGISAYTMRYTLGHPAYLRETAGDTRYDEFIRMDYQPNYWDYIAFTFGLQYDGRHRWVLRNNTKFLDEMSEAEYKNRTIRVALTNKGANLEAVEPFRVSLQARLCPLPDGCIPPPPPKISEPMLWSHASSWYYRDFEVPEENEDVVIESDMWIVMDISPPKLGKLTIEGKLTFQSNVTHPKTLTLQCKNIAQYGIFEIMGNDNGSFVGDATVVLYGRRGGTLPLTMAEGVFLGAKVLAVAGPLVAKGRSTGESWLRLQHTVVEGSKNISLGKLVNWNVGDEVVLSPTGYFNSDGDRWTNEDKGSSADEVGQIAAVWNITHPVTGAVSTKIELAYPVNHTHLCEELHGEWFCGAIGILTRNVRFISQGSEDPSSSSYGYGGHIHIFKVAGSSYFGSVHLENVELKNFGKVNDDKYAIKFQYRDYQHPYSIIKNCSLNGGYNFAMRAENVFNLSFTHNVAIGNVGGSVYLDAESDLFEISYNLLVGTRQLPSVLQSSYPWQRPIAGITIQTNNGVCIGNLAAGSEGQGFAIATSMFLLPDQYKSHCDVTWSTQYSYDSAVLLNNAYFLDNEAVGCRHGLTVLVVSSSEARPDDCAVVTGFKGWRSGHTGIMAVDAVANILIAHALVAENHIGVYLDFFKRSVNMFTGIVGSTVIGSLSDNYTVGGECTSLSDSKYITGKQCNVFTAADPLGLEDDCDSVIGNLYQRVGMLLPQWTNKARTCVLAGRFEECEPPNTPDRLCMLPWDNRYGLPISMMYTEQHIHDTSFIGFHSEHAVTDDQQVLPNVTYEEPLCTLPSSELPSAAIALNPKQVDSQPVIISSGLSWEQTEVGAHFTFDGAGCGTCMGHNLLLINDLDGSANNEGLPAQLAWPHPTYVAAYPDCYEVPDLELGMFICPFADNITRMSDFRQYTGIWRDFGPQVIHPIVTERQFESDNRSYAAYMPIKDSCAKRMPFSQFPLLFAPGHIHYVRSTGTLPSEFTIRWDAPSESDSAVLQFFVSHTMSISVWISNNPSGGWQLVEKMDDGYPSLDDAAGTNIRDPYNRFLAVTVRGGEYRYYQFRKTPAVAVTVKMEMTLADFFSDTFIANMALLLRISTDRIKIANVRAGSVIVDADVEAGAVSGNGNTTEEESNQYSELDGIEANITEAVVSGQMEEALNTTLEQVITEKEVPEVMFDELNDDLDNDDVDFDEAADEYQEAVISANTASFRILLDYPTSMPSAQPSNQPSSVPSLQPTTIPTTQPSPAPSGGPSSIPSSQPSEAPSVQPSSCPSSIPSAQPSSEPTQPTSQPSNRPSAQPSSVPSKQPQSCPTTRPTAVPSSIPSSVPSSSPSSRPSAQPSLQPTNSPSRSPTNQPTGHPSSSPSKQPTSIPSAPPTSVPSGAPSSIPSVQPSTIPTVSPSSSPSAQPTSFPSSCPSNQPSAGPSSTPTVQPKSVPTSQPSSTPSSTPSTLPSLQPVGVPSSSPSATPSRQPTVMPSAAPTVLPSQQPSALPSNQPTASPSAQPNARPSSAPTGMPSDSPSSQPSSAPSSQPSTSPSSIPSAVPSVVPSARPSSFPSCRPSSQPSISPSRQPTSCPTTQPSSLPSTTPTVVPSGQPSGIPSRIPSAVPSTQPTSVPSTLPTRFTPAPTTLYQARIVADLSTEVANCSASTFLASSTAQDIMCNSLGDYSGMESDYDVECGITGATNTSIDRRRLQDSAMLVHYEISITFLLNTELGKLPDEERIASDVYDALVNALQDAVDKGNLTTAVRSSGLLLLSGASIESLIASGYVVQVVDQTPTHSPSKSPDDDTDSVLLSTAAIIGIAVGGFIACVIFGALFYFIRTANRKKVKGTRRGSDSSSIKVVPVETENLEFLDLEKIYPSSPDIVGADPTGDQRAFWRDDFITEDGASPLEDRRVEQFRMADDLASYMRTLQLGEDPFASRTPSVHLEDEYAANSRAIVPGMENPEIGLRNERARELWYMDRTYSGKYAPESMENPELGLERERERGIVTMDHAYDANEENIPTS